MNKPLCKQLVSNCNTNKLFTFIPEKETLVCLWGVGKTKYMSKLPKESVEKFLRFPDIGLFPKGKILSPKDKYYEATM